MSNKKVKIKVGQVFKYDSHMAGEPVHRYQVTRIESDKVFAIKNYGKEVLMAYHVRSYVTFDRFYWTKYIFYAGQDHADAKWNRDYIEKIIPGIPLDPSLPILEAGYLQDRARKKYRK